MVTGGIPLFKIIPYRPETETESQNIKLKDTIKRHGAQGKCRLFDNSVRVSLVTSHTVIRFIVIVKRLIIAPLRIITFSAMHVSIMCHVTRGERVLQLMLVL